MIFHWCPISEWESSTTIYAPTGLGAEGFIHCSFLDQVEKTASVIDQGREDLVLLCIDGRGLPVKVEDCYEIGERYPHIYGPVPVASVVAVVPFPPGPDGLFTLPPGIPQLG